MQEKWGGVEYVLKIRTDWRMYYPYAFGYLKELLRREEHIDGCHKIVISDNFENRTFDMPPFFSPDFVYFGRVEEMIRFSEIPFNNVPYRNVEEWRNAHNIDVGPDFYQACKLGMSPEYYLSTEYMKTYGESGPFFDYEYYIRKLKQYFVFISPWDLELIWPKYRIAIQQPRSWHYNNRKYVGTCNMSYPDYLNLISGSIKMNFDNKK